MDLKELGEVVAWLSAAVVALGVVVSAVVGLLRMVIGMRYSNRLRQQNVENPEQKTVLLMQASMSPGRPINLSLGVLREPNAGQTRELPPAA